MNDVHSENYSVDHKHANTEAYLALSGACADVSGVLARVLRSDAPLDPILRNALADALEGRRPPGCPNLIVTGIGNGHSTPAGLARFRLHVALAEDVESRIKAGEKRIVAERDAAALFVVGEDLCHKAVQGYRKMQKWLLQNSHVLSDNMPPAISKHVAQACYLYNVGPLVPGPSRGRAKS